MVRLVAAFALLPFVAAALAYVGFPLFAQSLLKQVNGSFSSDAAVSFAAGTFIVAVFMTVIAVPIVSVMRQRGPITFGNALVWGVVLGNAPFLVVSALILVVQLFAGAPQDAGDKWYGATGAMRTITTSTLMGAALASVFWVVGIRSART